MSSAPRPASRSPPAGPNITLPPVQLRDDPPQRGRQAEGRLTQPEIEGRSTMGLAHPGEVPQYAQGPPTPVSGDDQRPFGSSRGLGVHNILNPTESELSGTPMPRLGGGGMMPSPQFLGQTSQHSTNPLTYAPPGYGGQPAPRSSPPADGQGANPSRVRKTLIPRSPRAVSLGARAAATFSARQSPFLSSTGRIYTAEPGSGPSSEVPPMPVGPPQPPYNLPPSASTPSLGRRASMATLPASARGPLSASASPSPSIRSPYSGPGQASPPTLHTLGQQPPPGASYYVGSTFGAQPQGDGSSQAGPPGTEGPYTSSLPESLFQRGSQSGGQNPNIRFMPISTEHGPMYVPVDVQAASKMADEKRARNAGASARFRERRKQKEKEASMSIQKLEQQLRDVERRLREAEHDRDFYRGERDRFRDVCFRNPSTRDVAIQAPMSPRLTRATAFPGPPAPGPMYQAQESGTPDVERPARRRRTEEYVFNVAATSGMTPYQGPTYGTAPVPGGMQPPTNLPPLRMSNVATTIEGGPAPSGTPLSTTRPPSFEHYPRGGYDRSWPGEGAGGGQRQ